MKSINPIIEKFLQPWRKQSGYLGAVLTGSYATGTQTKFSDIDIQIVFANNVDWRERGNLIIDGRLIEYFANPVRQYQKYLQDESKQGKKTTARMLVTGKIIEDKIGEVARLKKEAKKTFRKKFPAPSKTDTAIAQYALWDNLDGLRDLKEQKAPDFSLLYNLSLDKILQTYTGFLQTEKPGTAKTWRFLTDKAFRRKYQIKQLPDKHFSKLLSKALSEQKFRNIEKLTKYVQTKMGDFDIDGWKLRSPADK